MSRTVTPAPLVDRLLAAHGWLVYLFFYAPIVVLAVFSFNHNSRVGVWTRPSVRWYGEMLRNDDIMRAIRNTLIVAAVSTLVAVVLGTAAAISMERFRFRGQRTLDGLL
ncbi:MAG: ABC transporter permease, partial [Actinomycetota bacterium]